MQNRVYPKENAMERYQILIHKFCDTNQHFLSDNFFSKTHSFRVINLSKAWRSGQVGSGRVAQTPVSHKFLLVHIASFVPVSWRGVLCGALRLIIWLCIDHQLRIDWMHSNTLFYMIHIRYWKIFQFVPSMIVMRS